MVYVSYLCLLIFAAGLGTYRLGEKGLSHDEAFGIAVARLDLSTIHQVVTTSESFDALFYYLMHFGVGDGDSETWIRLPSVGFGLCALIALFGLTRHLFDDLTAILATLLLAINPFFVYYEQDARPYMLTVLLVVLATYQFVRAVESNSTRRWMVYGVLAALAIYVRLFAAFAIASHMVSLLLRPTKPQMRHIAIGYGVTVLLLAPLAVTLFNESLQRPFEPELSLGIIRWMFLQLVGGRDAFAWHSHLLLYLFFGVCCSAVLLTTRTAIARRVEACSLIWPHLLILLWVLVPAVVTALVSLARPIVNPRYLIFILPGLTMLAATGIKQFPNNGLRVAIAAALVALSAPALHSYYEASSKEGEDWRATVAYVLSETQRGDGVVFLSRFGRRPFEYYLGQAQAQDKIVPIYPGVEWGLYTPVLADATIEPTSVAAERLQLYPRVWAILLWGGFENRHQDGGPVRGALEAFEQVGARSFGDNLEARLYKRIRP